jgi:hypothetical protein
MLHPEKNAVRNDRQMYIMHNPCPNDLQELPNTDVCHSQRLDMDVKLD